MPLGVFYRHSSLLPLEGYVKRPLLRLVSTPNLRESDGGVEEVIIRSVVISEFGGPEVLHIQDVAPESPGPGEVVLRVHAIGLNRTEITLRSGHSPVKPKLPTRLGLEAAGEIESVGADVAGFMVGDRVALIPAYGATQYGFYGETSIAPSRSLVKIPDGVGFVEAAATWVSFGTAWAGLVSIGTILKEQTVLINAASSSVGLAAIQIANRIGAHPIALTRTSEKLGALRMHGATHVIATAEQDLVKEVKALTDGKGADLVFDAVGGSGFADLCQATKTGGLLILYGALDKQVTAVPPFEVFGRNLTIRGFAMPTLAKDETTFGELKSFVQQGMREGYLRPVIARTFDFDDIADAHRFLESGNQVGKIVVTL